MIKFSWVWECNLKSSITAFPNNTLKVPSLPCLEIFARVKNTNRINLSNNQATSPFPLPWKKQSSLVIFLMMGLWLLIKSVVCWSPLLQSSILYNYSMEPVFNACGILLSTSKNIYFATSIYNGTKYFASSAQRHTDQIFLTSFPAHSNEWHNYHLSPHYSFTGTY